MEGQGGERSSGEIPQRLQSGKEPSVVVSPNPFVNSVWFDFRNLPDGVAYTIEATDLSGRLLWQNGITGNATVIWNASNLPSGVYFYRIRSSLGEEFAFGKIVKVSK